MAVAEQPLDVHQACAPERTDRVPSAPLKAGRVRADDDIMSQLTCRVCQTPWEGTATPTCPRCTAVLFDAAVIKKKHDPNELPRAESGYRSVLSLEVAQDPGPFYRYAAESGRWYWSTRHRKYCHFTNTPLGEHPGSGLRAGVSMPDHALDGLLIADALGRPHPYAVDPALVDADLGAARLVPMAQCKESACDNLSSPAADSCAKHMANPLAD